MPYSALAEFAINSHNRLKRWQLFFKILSPLEPIMRAMINRLKTWSRQIMFYAIFPKFRKFSGKIQKHKFVATPGYEVPLALFFHYLDERDPGKLVHLSAPKCRGQTGFVPQHRQRRRERCNFGGGTSCQGHMGRRPRTLTMGPTSTIHFELQ